MQCQVGKKFYGVTCSLKLGKITEKMVVVDLLVIPFVHNIFLFVVVVVCRRWSMVFYIALISKVAYVELRDKINNIGFRFWHRHISAGISTGVGLWSAVTFWTIASKLLMTFCSFFFFSPLLFSTHAFQLRLIINFIRQR